MIGGFPVVTLCGSTRFKEEFLQAQRRLTLEGNIVLSVGLFGHSGDKRTWKDMDEETRRETKEMLRQMHRRKIDLSDGIYVVNVGGHIGENTRREIDYARKHGKWVTYLEPVPGTEEEAKKSLFVRLWEEIEEALERIPGSAYADSQVLIEQVYSLAGEMEAVVRRRREPWERREAVLEQLVEKDFYRSCGCEDPLRELAGSLCFTQKEWLFYAHLLEDRARQQERQDYSEDLAMIYEHCAPGRLAGYLRQHLSERPDLYERLMRLYERQGEHDRALDVAGEAISQVRALGEDLTPVMEFLVLDALGHRDVSRVEQLYQRTKEHPGIATRRIRELIRKRWPGFHGGGAG